MKNMVALQKTENGDIYCYQLGDKGVDHLLKGIDEGYWQAAGIISLEELEEILDREI